MFGEMKLEGNWEWEEGSKGMLAGSQPSGAMGG